MVAYSFQAQFVDPILSGRKRQTVRAIGKRRHARVGEALQLYTAMRTKQCRLLARSTCKDIRPIKLQFEASPAHMVLVDRGSYWESLEPDAFARDDGFFNWPQLVSFWRKHHAPIEVFDGVIVYWNETASAL